MQSNIQCLFILFSLIGKIIKETRKRNIPLIFALSRKKIAECLWVKTRVSAVAVLDVSGAHPLWLKILELTRKFIFIFFVCLNFEV